MNSDVVAELEQRIVRTEVHKCDASRDWRWVPVYNTWAVGPVGAADHIQSMDEL